MNEKIENLLNGLESFLDKFFAGAAAGLYKFLDKAFEYTYRETNSGVFGLFTSPEKISEAAQATRDKGYTNFDCLTPFPVHGLEFDMGLKRSRVPYITFFAGLTGVTIAFLLQYIVHERVIDVTLFEYLNVFPNLNSYPQNIGGKPSFSWPAMIPICFELTVLLGGHTTVIGFLLLSRIPRPSRKILHPEITNDKFALWIPTDSEGYNEEEVKSFISGLGGIEVTVVKPDAA